jgi:putative zinc finger protein
MQHLDEGTIHAWLDGALGPEEAARAEAHAGECPQCAAAVAEARGFIAASSRILTALDNAPRRVIPAAAPRKRVDTFVWRIAATMLVVAAGTLVVVRNRGVDESSEARPANPGSSPATLTAAAPAQPATAGRTTAPTATDLSPQTTPTDAAAKASRQPAPVPVPALAPKASVGIADNRFSGAGVKGNQKVPAAENSSVMSSPAPAAPSQMSDLAAPDRAVEPETLREIARPRRIGASVTVYEIAGDTVILTESKALALSGVAVTGAAAPRQVAGQAMGKSAAESRRASPSAAAPDSQRPAAAVSPPTLPAAGVAAGSAAGVQVGSTIPTNVVTWSDPATGSTFTLTGRIPVARLEQIKTRIERERAAAAALKKNP